MRPVYQWNLGARSLELGKRTLIMGVLNVTPDSFSDGGQFLDPDAALKQAERLLEDGADIIDIGGESTRPGARVNPGSDKRTADTHEPAVSAEEESRRIIPVVTELKKLYPAAVISVDTYKSSVAREAVKTGAEIVNDVSGFSWDLAMASTIAEVGCGAVLMHMRGRPEEWRTLPPPENVTQLVFNELQELSAQAIANGISRDRLVLDPGLGFGKSFDQNYPLIARFEELQKLGFPLLAGASRKSFIGRTVGAGSDVPTHDRLSGTLAAETALILKGAHIIRTHDARASRDAARIADAILGAA